MIDWLSNTSTTDVQTFFFIEDMIPLILVLLSLLCSFHTYWYPVFNSIGVVKKVSCHVNTPFPVNHYATLTIWHLSFLMNAKNLEIIAKQM